MRYALWLESVYDNGKLCSLSHAAFRLWANSISYARKHRTDGFLSDAQVDLLLRLYRLNRRVVDELLQKRAFEPAEAGVRIHDFLKVNASESQMDAVSDARAEAGRRGGRKSGEARRSRPGEANAEADAEAFASEANEANANKTHMQTETKTESLTSEPSEPETNSEGGTHISRARALAIPKPGPLSTPQIAVSTAFADVLGEPSTAPERRRWNEAIGHLARGGVTPDEAPALVRVWEEYYEAPCNLQAIVNNLGTLRGLLNGRRGKRRPEEPRGFPGVREAFADVFDREGA